MKLCLSMTARKWSRNVILLYEVTQILQGYPDTVITVSIEGPQKGLTKVKGVMEQYSLYPKIDLHALHDDDIPQG